MTLPSIEHLVSPDIYRRFEIYERLLGEWNSRTNLVQADTLDDFWCRHILDSFQILPLLDERTRASMPLNQPSLLPLLSQLTPYNQTMVKNPLISILDIGSGAGFPGMILAICGYKNVTLCESNHKKCVFLDEVARQTGTDITVLNQRVEEISYTYDVFVSRAMTDFETLCFLMATHMASHTSIGIFHKGRRWKDEVNQAEVSWLFDSQAFPSVTSSDSVILVLSDLKSK